MHRGGLYIIKSKGNTQSDETGKSNNELKRNNSTTKRQSKEFQLLKLKFTFVMGFRMFFFHRNYYKITIAKCRVMYNLTIGNK